MTTSSHPVPPRLGPYELIQLLATGILVSERGTLAGYNRDVGIFGREVYNYFTTDGRTVVVGWWTLDRASGVERVLERVADPGRLRAHEPLDRRRRARTAARRWVGWPPA